MTIFGLTPSVVVGMFASLVATEADLTTNHAASSNLPRGAGFYQSAKAAGHPAVIFAEDFEVEDYTSRWDEARDKDKRVLALVDPNDKRFGKQSLQVRADLAHNTGGGLTKWFESAPTLFLRFYTKFDKDSDYIHHFATLRANKSLQGKDRWSGFGGAGLKPEGDTRFSTALEPWGNWGKWPAPGRWNFYSYWHEMKPAPDGKYWGNGFRPDDLPDISKDTWICCEFMLKHNTPSKRDGEQAFWIDGKLLGHWKGISWRTSPSVWANALTLEAYVTNRWTKNPINTVLFDNLVIARDYIGPISIGAPADQ